MCRTVVCIHICPVHFRLMWYELFMYSSYISQVDGCDVIVVITVLISVLFPGPVPQGSFIP